jgi:acetoin utilization deacetylase AcuC-like enzyme
MPEPIAVVSRYLPGESLRSDVQTGNPVLSDADEINDNLDAFNHPRLRRALILQAMYKTEDSVFTFDTPKAPCQDFNSYRTVCSERLLDFLSDSYDKWHALGDEGQDSLGIMKKASINEEDDRSPPLVPGNVVLHRDKAQRPSKNVMGQIGFFCTDFCTPIIKELKEELLWDSATMKLAAEKLSRNCPVVYALGTHPGHHAAYDSFGGYCYLNHAAFLARELQSQGRAKVAVLDVDYHAGNGTVSLFYSDPTVLVISIHCDPDFDYPFHSGFADEIGEGKGEGATLNLPLPVGTVWNGYKGALEKAMDKINDFGAEALIVSLGLDTHAGDPCTIKRAGFKLEGDDYKEMGKTIGKNCDIPTIFVQEGGYKMDKVPGAAANVLKGFAGY